MSAGYNKCTFVGNLGGDAELKALQNGTAVCSFSVGANESWKNDRGEKQERCEWVNCTLWGKRGEALAKYLKKGTRVLVEGKLRTDKSEKDGQTRYYTKLIVDEVVLLGDKKPGGGAGRHSDVSASNKGDAWLPPDDGSDVDF